MKYFGGISMEMYLAQMVIFRAIEKLNLLHITGCSWADFIIAVVLELLGLVLFIETYRRGTAWVKTWMARHKNFVKGRFTT